jgi:hypothetical protein
MYSNLSGALNYAEKKRTISTNRARPLPHYQYPTNNTRNRQQIHLEVPHQPAIIHPRNIVANNRGYRGIDNLQHYNPVYTRRQPLQQQQLMHLQHQQLLHLQQLQEHHKGMTDKFCRDNGYTKYVLPAPKLITRTSPKVAPNNQQKMEGIKEKSPSRSNSTSKVASNSQRSPRSPQRPSNKRSPTNKLPPTTKGVPRTNTPKVLQTTRVLIA